VRSTVRRGGPPYWSARRGHRRARVARRSCARGGFCDQLMLARYGPDRQADALLAFDRPVASLRRLGTQGCEIDAVADGGEHLTTNTRSEELGHLRRPVRYE
jgi:hypothetical protein